MIVFLEICLKKRKEKKRLTPTGWIVSSFIIESLCVSMKKPCHSASKTDTLLWSQCYCFLLKDCCFQDLDSVNVERYQRNIFFSWGSAYSSLQFHLGWQWISKTWASYIWNTKLKVSTFKASSVLKISGNLPTSPDFTNSQTLESLHLLFMLDVHWSTYQVKFWKWQQFIADIKWLHQNWISKVLIILYLP